MPENWDELAELINSHSPDYIIGAVHKNPEGDWFKDICIPTHYDNMTEEEYVNFAKQNLELIIDMAKTGKCQIIGHIDCIFTQRKMTDYSKLYDHLKTIVNIAKEKVLCIEMNYWKRTKNQDPNLFLYKECGRLDIPVIINSDAHIIEHINMGFKEDIKLLKECKVKYTCTFTKQKMNVKEIRY